MADKPKRKTTVLYAALCVFITIIFALVIADSIVNPNTNRLTGAAAPGVTGTGTTDNSNLKTTFGVSEAMIIWMTALMGMVGLGMLLYYHAHLRQ